MMGAFVLAAVAAATPYNDTFDLAVEAYGQGKYDTAAALFEQLVSEGVVDASVFYNLGNTYHQMGRLAPAMANYERALRLSPAFEMAARNLAQCVGKTKRQLGRPVGPSWQDRVLFWQGFLPLGATRALAVSFWFALWILLGVRVMAPLRYVRTAAVLSGLLAVAFGWSAWERAHPPSLAVADAPEVSLRAGMGDDAAVRAQLYEGDRVIVERRQQGWARVRTAAEERGWVPEQSLVSVGPPYERPADVAPRPSIPETAP